MSLLDSALWRDARAMPDTLARTLDLADGFADTAAFLTGPGTRRIVVTGNGAAYYTAVALWLASLRTPGAAPEVLAAPAGLLGDGHLARRHGDVLLVVSSSGELRDVIELLRRDPVPYAAITATPTSTIGAGAAARSLVTVRSQDVITHTQAFVGNVAAALSLWAAITGDDALRGALRAAPQVLADALEAAPQWAAEAAPAVRDPRSATVFGSGPAWAAALEAALLLKEVAGIPAEGQETREGATSGMYALTAGHLALSLPTGPDAQLAEAEATCARTGATLLTAPGGERTDPRLAAISTFPAALALAGELAVARGRDPDSPPWVDAYYATARVANQEGDAA
jgi:fructoselysine-6-P-deglycase FrlB-like protein